MNYQSQQPINSTSLTTNLTTTPYSLMSSIVRISLRLCGQQTAGIGGSMV